MSAIDFSDDPRAALIHFNEKHDHLGRFAKKSGGVSATPAKSIDSKNILDEVKSAWTSGKEKQGVDLMTKDGGHLSSTKRDSLLNNVIFQLASAEVSPYDAQVGVINSLTSHSLIENTPDLKNLIGYDQYHGPSDYKYAARKIAYEAESIMGDAFKNFGYNMSVNELYSGSQEQYRKELIDMVCEKLENRMKSQPYSPTGSPLGEYAGRPTGRIKEVDGSGVAKIRKDDLRPAAREKEFGGFASAHRRAMSADQAYKMASEQRNIDINNRIKKESENAAIKKAAEESDHRRKELEKKLKHIDYTDDPRAVLIHRGGGNPYHDPKTGQFTTSTGLGIGKYIDSKGNLTEEGKKRLAHDRRRNAQKKKDDQVKAKDGMTVDEILTDPHRWVKEDLNEIESGLKAAGTLTGDVNKFLKSQEAKRPAVRKKRLTLKDMTDAELQAQINRYLLEQRYEDIFNPKEPPEVSKGKKFLMNALEVTGGVLAVGASAVTIAKALHELKKGS